MNLSINADNFVNRDLTPTQMAQSNVNVTSTQTKVVDVPNMFVKHKAMTSTYPAPVTIFRDTTAVVSLNNPANNAIKFSMRLFPVDNVNSSDTLNSLFYKYTYGSVSRYVSLNTSNIYSPVYLDDYKLQFTGQYLKDDNGFPLIYQRDAYRNTFYRYYQPAPIRYVYAIQERYLYNYVYKVTLPARNISVSLVEIKNARLNSDKTLATGNEREIERFSVAQSYPSATKYMNLQVQTDRFYPNNNNQYEWHSIDSYIKLDDKHSDGYIFGRTANRFKGYYANGTSSAEECDSIFNMINVYTSGWISSGNIDETGNPVLMPKDTFYVNDKHYVDSFQIRGAFIPPRICNLVTLPSGAIRNFMDFNTIDGFWNASDTLSDKANGVLNGKGDWKFGIPVIPTPTPQNW